MFMWMYVFVWIWTFFYTPEEVVKSKQQLNSEGIPQKILERSCRNILMQPPVSWNAQRPSYIPLSLGPACLTLFSLFRVVTWRCWIAGHGQSLIRLLSITRYRNTEPPTAHEKESKRSGHTSFHVFIVNITFLFLLLHLFCNMKTSPTLPRGQDHAVISSLTARSYVKTLT